MPRVQSSDPQRMEYRTGGGCLALFGLPFLAAGLVMMSVPFWSGDGVPDFATIPFGLIFVCLGGGFLLGRGGKVFDKGSGKITEWWGLLVPMKTTEHDIGGFNEVTITAEVRRSKNSTYTVYPVRLTGPGGRINIEEPRDYESARKEAEEVAKFLGVDLADSSSGQRIVRKAGTLDESLRDRVRRTGEKVVLPDPPAGMKTRAFFEGETAVFEIPAPGFTLAHCAMCGCGLVFPILVGVLFLAPMLASDVPALAKLFLGLFVGIVFMLLPFAGMVGVAVGSALTRTRVEASPDMLRVTRTGLILSKTVAIPAAELEELFVGSPKGVRTSSLASAEKGEVIVARSDKVSAYFGEGLSRAELDWIRAGIAAVVTA